MLIGAPPMSISVYWCASRPAGADTANAVIVDSGAIGSPKSMVSP